MTSMIRKRRRLLLLSLMILTCGVARTQARPDVPKMWVNKRTSTERRNAFQGKRDNVLRTTGLSLTTKYFFDTSSFNALIDTIAKYNQIKDTFGVNVIIAAAYDDLPSSSPVGEVKKNQLIFIFAPARKRGRIFYDLGAYYVINMSDAKVYGVLPDDKNKLVKYYIDTIIGDATRGLASTIDAASTNYNYVGGNLSDTRSMSYLFDEFNEFIKSERDFQNKIKPSHKINGIEVWFAAYSDTGIGCNRHQYPPHEFKNRLLLMFEFTKKRKLSGGNKIFYIDKSKGFKRRNKPGCDEKGGNNGQLCPPDC